MRDRGQHHSDDGELIDDLETQARHRLFNDYREIGHALRQLRDEHQPHWQSFGGWEPYLREVMGICRSTANNYINAAEVADDLSSRDDSVQLPLRHACLLYRFHDAQLRRELAKAIQPLTFKEATGYVIDKFHELTQTEIPPPQRRRENEARSAPLAQLDVALRACSSIEIRQLTQATASVPPRRRATLARRTRDASRRLRLASEEIAGVDARTDGET